MRCLLTVLMVSAVTHSSMGLPKLCEDENAEYVTCGTECEPTCAHPDITLCDNPMCVIGCQCLPGFVLHNSKCIPKYLCPKSEHQCDDPNAEYTFCGSQCPLTCEKPLDTGCIDSCYEGCECKEGYLLHGSKCVLPQDCPVV